MNDSQVHFQWQEKQLHQRFRTGVSLHGHTLHSHECLDFIGRATKNTPWLSGAIQKQMDKYRALKGRDADLKRAWWTPPLSALHAWKLEKAQIENLFDKSALVSLTDHDNIDAGLHLSVLDETRDCPISVEWTVPHRETFFHIGVHNLPAPDATSMMRSLAQVTAGALDDGGEARVAAIFDWLTGMPDVLIVMNHPLWDEKHIGAGPHRSCVESFLKLYGHAMHAFELNGLRPWAENHGVVQLSKVWQMPLISGGDRHGKEPNTCINLTNAATFAEFVEEVRRDRWSDVLFVNQYREPFKMRILQNLCDILEDDEQHSLGWTHWSDRVFYLTDESVVKSLKELWGKNFPSVVSRFVGLTSLARHKRVRSALRLALTERQEFAL